MAGLMSRMLLHYCLIIRILMTLWHDVVASKCSLLCLKVQFVTDSKRLSLNSTGNDACDIDELIYCFAVAYLRIFPAAFRWGWLCFNAACDTKLTSNKKYKDVFVILYDVVNLSELKWRYSLAIVLNSCGSFVELLVTEVCSIWMPVFDVW